MQNQLRKMTSDDLSVVLQWRNHPDVSRYMYTQHVIAPDEHLRWFEKSFHDDTQELLIFSIDDVRLGYVNFKRTFTTAVADWGFYLAPDAPRGTGYQLGCAALEYAFKEMGLHKVCGQALGFNEKSILFHLRLGFVREGVLRQQYFDGECFHDIECFGLLFNDWAGGRQ